MDNRPPRKIPPLLTTPPTNNNKCQLVQQQHQLPPFQPQPKPRSLRPPSQTLQMVLWVKLPQRKAKALNLIFRSDLAAK